ncbi:hypothetical protein BESB_014070 [Besnoitia besnoiti]|uniref:Uncharacterized protein n=1 Tax=Besnoitia besnoiti TaxID=94643 RepID=A0A2A9M4A3_BESBE|nr:hypothetical protein BESB_014070 [Besnoitia besnoiti]PFH32795.1 hypothetical protein BESB_014070 [Besnoitia besnoiti]
MPLSCFILNSSGFYSSIFPRPSRHEALRTQWGLLSNRERLLSPEKMFLVSDGAAAAKKKKKPSSAACSPFSLATSRCSLTAGLLEPMTAAFARTLQAHPFNQKVVILLALGNIEADAASLSPAAAAPLPQAQRESQHGRQEASQSSGPFSSPESPARSAPAASSAFSSSPSSAAGAENASLEHSLVDLIQRHSIGFFFEGVSLAAFLSLPLQRLLFAEHDACLLSWTGSSSLHSLSLSSPSSSSRSSASAYSLLAASSPREPQGEATDCHFSAEAFVSDVATGGNAAAITPQEGGTLLLRVDGFLYQVLGIDTVAGVSHAMKKALPPTTRFLRVPLAHPAVLRHQTSLQSVSPAGASFAPAKATSGCAEGKRAPSKLFQSLQRCLGVRLAPVSFLAALKTSPASSAESPLARLRALRSELEVLLFAGSGAGSATPTGLTVQRRAYRSCAFSKNCEGDSERESALFMELDAGAAGAAGGAAAPAEKETVWLPAWSVLLPRVLQSADTHSACEDDGAKRERRASRPPRGSAVEASVDVSMGEEGDEEEEDEEERAEALPFPRLKPGFERAALRLAASEFAGAVGGERTTRGLDNQSQRQRSECAREVLADEILQVLGSYGLGLPLSRDRAEAHAAEEESTSPRFDWLKPSGLSESPVSVLTIEGGLVHSAAVAAVVERLSELLRLKERAEKDAGAPLWFAVSVFGVPDAPTLFGGNPHGAVDLSGDSSCHFVGFFEPELGGAKGMSLRTVSPVDASVSLP